jgi:hypothetical protein
MFIYTFIPKVLIKNWLRTCVRSAQKYLPVKVHQGYVIDSRVPWRSIHPQTDHAHSDMNKTALKCFVNCNNLSCDTWTL